MMDAISDLLGIPTFERGEGSSVPVPFLVAVLVRLGIDPANTPKSPARLRAALEHVGREYNEATDTSKQKKSGGGNTIQNNGLAKLLDGLRALDDRGLLCSPDEFANAATPTTNPREFDERTALLLVRGLAEKPKGVAQPRRVPGASDRIARDPAVAAWVEQLAAGKCAACNNPAPFLRGDGRSYLEVHHVVPLGLGGPDVVENAVAVCPNCHRECHSGVNAKQLIEKLYAQNPHLVRLEP